MKRFTALVFLLSFVACAHQRAARVSVGGLDSPAKERALYEQGLKSLNKSDFAGASREFAALLDRYPSTGFIPAVYYNWGLALEGLQKYADAAQKYKKVVTFYETLPSANKAQALYRMSVCYEYLNDDTRTVAALLELQKQTMYLSRQVADTEIPARLAGAYARQGNFAQAQKYFNQAQAGMKRLRRSPMGANLAVWLPRALFSMGLTPALSPGVKPAEFQNYTRSLTQAQAWLVECVELNQSPWSEKAAAAIINNYQKAWKAIDEYPAPANPDKLEAMKARQDDQRAMAADLDGAVGELKLDRLPSSPSDPEPVALTNVFIEVSGIEKRLTLLLSSPDVQDQNTPEAQKREGLRREGKIDD